MTALLGGKVAVITGAGSIGGQGAAEARLFVDHGARVIVIDLAESAGKQVADELGDNGEFYCLDVRDDVGWQRFTDFVTRAYGHVDVLVNNAGVWLAKGLLETTPDEYRNVIDVNQTGVFLGMHAVAPLMRRNGGGSIINICSTAGLKGGNMPHAYAASKWGVRGMSRAAAFELGPDGIRVNAICPGFVATPMIQGGEPVLQELAKLVPMGRVAQPEEIAQLALFLASDASGYISGAEIAIDAAFTA